MNYNPPPLVNWILREGEKNNNAAAIDVMA
jgi:hypothetical protein